GKSYSTVYGYYDAGMRKLRAACERWKAKQRESGAVLMPISLDSLFDAARANPERPTAEDVERILRRVRETVGDGGPDSSAPSSGRGGIDLPRRIKVFLLLPAIGYLLVGQSKAAPADPAIDVRAEGPAAAAGDPASSPMNVSGLNAPSSAHAEPPAS